MEIIYKIVFMILLLPALLLTAISKGVDAIIDPAMSFLEEKLRSMKTTVVNKVNFYKRASSAAKEAINTVKVEL